MALKVLTVDDSKTIRMIVKKAFQAYSCEVFEAENGVEGLAAATKEKPGLIILDITMPGMSGLEALDALKAEKPSPEVILLTADSTLGTAVAGMKGGARDYLLKPTDIDTLVAAIGEAEGRRMESLSRQRMAETAAKDAGKLRQAVERSFLQVRGADHLLISQYD